MSEAQGFRAVIERTVEVAPATRVMVLRLPPGRGMPFQPGQFVSLRLPLGEKPLVRAYSIASFPEDPEHLEICLNLVPGGPGSSYLFRLEPGDAVDLTGPWGTFVLGQPAPPAPVFIAEGTGIAPLRPMIRAALAQPHVRRIDLLHAAADEGLLLYRRDFEEWAGGDPRLQIETLVEGDAAPEHAALASRVEQRWVLEETGRDRHFFICGVGDIVSRLRDVLRRAGYERRAVHYEKW